jgi:hypothetical protein
MHSYLHYWASASPSLLIFGALATGFAAVRVFWQSQWLKFVNVVESKKFWVPVCAVLLGGYLLLLGLNTTYLGFNDHVEPNIVAVSSLASHGGAIYQGLEAPQRYSLLYGPMTYLPYAWALRLFGQSVLSAKLVVLLGNLGLFSLLWNSYRTRVRWQPALLAAVLVIAFMLAGEPYLLETRGDIVMILAAAIGLAGAVSSSAWRAGILLALGTGICVATKISGFLYFAPLFVMLYRRFGARTMGVTLLGAAAVACLPFTLAQVSAENYWLWLRKGLRHPLSGHGFARNLKELLMLGVPIFVLAWRLHERDRQEWFAYLRREKISLVTLGMALGLVTVTASKLGAGEHHYLPFFPWLGYICCDLYSSAETTSATRRSSMRVTVCVVCSLWLLAIVGTRIEWGLAFMGPHEFAGRATAASISNDVKEIMREHPGEKIEMGYGDKWDATNDFTYARPALVFAGNPLTIDEVALNDMLLSQVSVPQSSIAYLESCKTQIWLIPRGEQPFVLPTIYEDSKNLPNYDIFGEPFRQAFLKRYKRRESSSYFDLWVCENKAPD